MTIMMIKVHHIYIISFILFAALFHQQQLHLQRFYRPSKSSSVIVKKRKLMIKHFNNQKLANALSRYLTGYGPRISKEIAKAHKITGTKHLFTPSGIHYSALLSILLLTTFLFKKNQSYLKRIVSIIIPCCIFLLPSFYSLKRVALFHLLFLIFLKIKIKLSLHHCFIMTFLIDLIFGNYQNSPLSFAYSFLFWGAIISQSAKAKYHIILALFSARIISCFFLTQTIFPLSILFNFFITLLFTLIFPFLFFLYWVPDISSWQYQILENITKWFINLVSFASSSAEKFGGIIPDLHICVSIILLYKFRWSQTAKIFLTISILLWSSELNLHKNSKLYSYSKKQISIPLSKITSVKYRPNISQKITYEDGTICYRKLNNDIWISKCRFYKAKKRPP